MDLKAITQTEPVSALLASASLPTDDITAALLEHFIGAYDDDVLIGAVGLELLGEEGLLRSLVVSPDVRSSGLGATLVAALEERARALGVHRLFLITTDADGYFSRRGYAHMDRAEVPQTIKNTAQFSTLCPGSAMVMLKTLD